jgi:hypothetical protein
MFLQQMLASAGKVLPAVLAPLIITELHADPAWASITASPPLPRWSCKWVAAVS